MVIKPIEACGPDLYTFNVNFFLFFLGYHNTLHYCYFQSPCTSSSREWISFPSQENIFRSAAARLRDHSSSHNLHSYIGMIQRLTSSRSRMATLAGSKTEAVGPEACMAFQRWADRDSCPDVAACFATFKINDETERGSPHCIKIFQNLHQEMSRSGKQINILFSPFVTFSNFKSLSNAY